MITNKYLTVIAVTLFILISFYIPARSTEPEDVFQNITIEAHLNIVDWKLHLRCNNVKNSSDQETLVMLQEATNLIMEALRNYKYFRTGDEKFLQDDWIKQYSFVFEGHGIDDPVKNTPSALEHLRAALDKSVQLKFSMMVSERQYTEKEHRLIQSFHVSIDYMQKASTVLTSLNEGK